MPGADPVYMGRWEKFKTAIIGIIIGLLLFNSSPLLSRIFLGGGFLLLTRAIIRGQERIA